MTLDSKSIRNILPLALIGFACAKVTTHYPDIAIDIDSGLDAGSSVGGSATGGFGTTIVVGGSPATGGVRATGGAPISNPPTGGTNSSAGGASSSATGGVRPTGGVPATGGVPPTGGAPPIFADAGPTCPSGSTFCDDFETGTASQWTGTTGTWNVITDTTQTPGDQKVYANTTAGNASSQAGTGIYANASIEARMKVTSYSSNSNSNAAGVFLRANNNGNDYDLSLGGDGTVYLRRTLTSSTALSCTSGGNSGPSGLTLPTTGCRCPPDWFRLKLTASGTVATGITLTGYIDITGSGYTQVLQCVLGTGSSSSYMYDSGPAGVFSKSSAPAEFDDVVISTQ